MIEIPYSQLERSKRLDSEFFRQESMDAAKILAQKSLESLTKIASVSDGNHMAISERFTESLDGIPYYRGQDVGGFFVEQSEPIKIESSAFDTAQMRRSHLKKGEVLVSIVGTIGAVSLVTTEQKAACSCKLAILRPKTIKANYLAAFLHCRYGQSQIKRLTRGAVQMGLILDDMDQIQIPRFKESFELQISETVFQSKNEMDTSISTYARAEGLLLEALGLTDFEPSAEAVNVKSFKESFVATGRLDSEYYQPKYYQMLERIKALKPKAIVPLGDLLTSLTNGQTPLHHNLSVGEIRFLTAEHIHDFRINFDSSKRVLQEHHESVLARTRIQNGDLLITIKGRVGNVAVIENVPFETNINQDVGLMRLESGLHPYYVAGYLNSLAGKLLVEQISTGQINPFLGLGNLKTIPIPIFETKQMNAWGIEIEKTVKAAESQRQRSMLLLEAAKRAVEIAIEDNEETALAWLLLETKL